MKPSLQLRQSLQLTMTPQLQQAIKLLQLSSLDLQTEIQSVLEANPMLEVNDEQNDSSPTTSLPEHADWQGQWQSLKGSKKNHSNQNQPDIESLNASETNLKDYLYWQMDLTPFSESDKVIAENLIDAINEDGFIEGNFQDIVDSIQKQIEVEEDEILTVLHRIQLFDPIGVGARNLRECLSVQLKTLPDDYPWRDEALKLVSNYLNLLAKRDYATLRRKLGVSLDDLRAIIQSIQNLTPKPGAEIGTQDNHYIIPDVYVYKHNSRWVAEINPECVPKVRINEHYAGMAKTASTQDSQFIRSQLQEAKWFLKSLENRNETLLKVAQCIIDEQGDFLDHGEEHMKPMILHDIAQKVSMHESTISRVTTQKYLHTPRGTFELKYFFSSALQNTQGGESSSVAIRAHIKKLIANEDRQKPLSDNRLTELLAEAGIKVARRTVAKYREAMSILPSHERKQLL